jgi:hypothetical protein
MFTTIVLSTVAAVLGSFGTILGYWFGKRKNTAEIVTVEIGNEQKIRELYTPIIADLRQIIRDDAAECKRRLDGFKERIEQVEANCTGDCFTSKLKVHK